MSTTDNASRSEELRARIGRFRILVLGRANAGKTTILQKVCNSTVDPEIFDAKGQKIDTSVITPSTMRGIHDINYQLVFRSNPGFIFHDSRGFEAGGKDEWDIVRNFITLRGKEKKISDQLHAIWYCIPSNDSRPITKAEENFFNSKHGNGGVPVVVIFTKLDALDRRFWSEQEPSFERARQESLSTAKTYFERLHKLEYPPDAAVYFRDLHKPTTEVKELIDATAATLTNDSLQRILISTQQISLETSVKYGIGKAYRGIQGDRTVTLMSPEQVRHMFEDVATYFSHLWV